MTNEEIIAELTTVDEELFTVSDRFLLAIALDKISDIDEIKEEVYRQGHRVAKMIRENSGEMGLVGSIETSLDWLENAVRQQMERDGKWHVEKIVTSIRSLLMKARTRGLDPIIEVSKATEEDSPLHEELERTKADLVKAKEELVGAKDEIQTLKGRPVKLPPKEEMSWRWMRDNLPLSMVIDICLGNVFKWLFGGGLVVGLFLLFLQNHISKPEPANVQAATPKIEAPATDTGFHPLIQDAQRPGTEGK